MYKKQFEAYKRKIVRAYIRDIDYGTKINEATVVLGDEQWQDLMAYLESEEVKKMKVNYETKLDKRPLEFRASSSANSFYADSEEFKQKAHDITGAIDVKVVTVSSMWGYSYPYEYTQMTCTLANYDNYYRNAMKKLARSLGWRYHDLDR